MAEHKTKPLPEHKTSYVTCNQTDCEASHPDHHWGHVKAEGWFHSRDGSAWCPEHVPDWVGPWRAAKTARKEQETNP